MIPLSLPALTQLLSAKVWNIDEQATDLRIEAVTTDTRKITPGCLFIALKGERFDGHDFAEQAIAAGAAVVLVSKRLAGEFPQLQVPDTRLALGTLAAWVRQQVPAKVVALTGSSGKTSVKELTAAILRQCGEVLATAGNLNNDIGVPLTLLRLTPHQQFAVVELGANHSGEIAYTSQLTQPDAALVNNLAAAHLEGFGSLAGVAQAKGEIFSALPAQGIAIINAESNDLPHWQQALPTQTLWQFSTLRRDVDFFATDIQHSPQGSTFTLHTPQGNRPVQLHLPGQHNIANALAAAALAMAAGASPDNIRDGLAQAQAVSGRLFPLQWAVNKLIIDDSYNANVGSMKAAANVLAQMPGYRVMAVGDMAELGVDAVECHRQVGEAIRQQGIERVLSVGNLSEEVSRTSRVGEHFTHQSALIARLLNLLSEHAVITVLIKGSRSAAMEQVVRALQEKAPC